jgi:hypothetical protein
MSTSINLETLLTIIYVVVDDWYQGEGVKWREHKPGERPSLSDSEVLTLVLAQDFIPYPGESQYVGFIKANYPLLFPKLADQTQFNRRAKGLRYLIEQLRVAWIKEMGILAEQYFLVDTKPVPVMGYKRSKKHSDFAGSASYGYCASRKMHYFGYKLVMLTTLEGMPVYYDLVPAHTDEREAAEVVLTQVSQATIFGDKGFLGLKWQAQLFTATGNTLYTPKRHNQAQQNSTAFDHWLNAIRERIEGTFHVIQNTGRHLERLLAKSVVGLCTRVAAKMTSHTLKFILQRDFAINVQVFQQF